MMTQSTAIFWPVITHVVVILVLYRMLFSARVRSVKAGEAKVEAFRENRNEPRGSLLVRNALENQFESPTLFYAVCIILFVTGHASLYATLLAWAWVAARLVHLYVHITTNRLRHRLSAFVASIAILALMWLLLAISLVVPA